MIDSISPINRLLTGLAKLASQSGSAQSAPEGAIQDRFDGLCAMNDRPLPSRGYIVRQ